MIALLGVHTPQGNDQERFVEDDGMSEETWILRKTISEVRRSESLCEAEGYGWVGVSAAVPSWVSRSRRSLFLELK